LEENFDRFKFAIHKEKEMNFRRWITALAVLALFAGLANAQIASSTAGTGPFQCTASVAVPPVLRAEGLTELAGDIVLTCTGGPTPVVGATILTANFTVSFGTNVTSRLLNYNTSTSASPVTSPLTSEALLLIDEPGSGLAIGPTGFTGSTTIGPGAPQTLCMSGGQPASYMGAGAGGCVQYVAQVAGDYVMSSSAGGAYSAPANVYAGVVNSNQVTFFGIPILPPTSTGVSRVYRMTNIRINANALGASGFTGTFQVQASISISGNTSVPIYTPVQTAGFVQTGLTTALKSTSVGGFSVPSLNQCTTTGSATTPSGVGILQYTENFGTAFKTRVAPLSSAAGAGQAANLTGQNIPGAIYNSESGLIFPTLAGVGTTFNAVAGLADYGTRLKAVFNNVPTGVRIFVSTTNVTNISSTTVPSLLNPPPGNSTTSFAQLVVSEMAPEGSFVPPSGFLYASGSVTPLNGFAEVSIVNGSGTAVWEVINTNPALNENFNFGVWTTYTGSAATNSPPIGTATVNMSYAPVPDATSFTAAAGAAASSTLTLPRFADTSVAANLLTIVQCTTNLLFPFITNMAGFDTGIAIMNTSTDPWGTKPQAGTCALNWYGQPVTAQYVTGVIPSGMNTAPATYAFLASNIAPNFQGYMIAVCNFQMAHGYAFITKLGATDIAHGYLALVLNNGTSTRPSSTVVPSTSIEALEN
jgi:hypothetical protein